MEKRVTVLTPNGRRQNVKVTPNTTILQILEETCHKHGFDSDEYGLRHHNKEVGLTQMFRFSGLPNNCLLEMSPLERKRVESTVNICVQIEDGSRMQGEFKPSDNLWFVVEQLTPESVVQYTSPIVLYMRQEFVGQQNIQATTLKSLGITEGRAMIRFVNKNPEDLKVQANVYIPPTVPDKPKDEDSSVRTGPKEHGGGGFAITKELVQSLKAPTSITVATAREESGNANVSMDAEENVQTKYDWGTGQGRTIRETSSQMAVQNAVNSDEDVDSEPEINIIGERNAILYSLDHAQRHIQEIPDSFFELTVHDLKLVLRDLKEIANGTENAPLLTQKLRELEESKTMLNKIGQYKNCIIRIKFPDRHVLQGTFKPFDKVSDVIGFVRKFLIDQKTNFYLFTIPPKHVLPLDKTLLELDFVPTALLHFAFEDDEEKNLNDPELKYLKSQFMAQLTTVEGALFAANKFRGRRSATSTNITNNSNAEQSSAPPISTESASTAATTTTARSTRGRDNMNNLRWSFYD